tara:strand:+ start:1052 stop:1249 length:198 start_codon:yes stop_codon:yes gene_type:complete
MTTYQIFWAFPTQEGTLKYKGDFINCLIQYRQADKFEGFEVKFRGTELQNGRGNFIVEAEGPQKI